jgi:hypothetical protein
MGSASSYGRYYNLSGNTFINISSGGRSTINLRGGFVTLTFSNNSFRNILISNSGGVYLLFKFNLI